MTTMAAAKISPIKGSDLMLFLDNKSIALATSHSFSMSSETVETSTKDNGGKWTSKKVKKRSWTSTTENLYAIEGEGKVFKDLFKLWSDGTEVEVVFALESGYAAKADEVTTGGWTPIASGQYKGKAIITSLEVNAPNEDNATYTATFEGVGPLTEVAGA